MGRSENKGLIDKDLASHYSLDQCVRQNNTLEGLYINNPGLGGRVYPDFSGMQPGERNAMQKKAHLQRSIETIPLYAPQNETSAINKVSNSVGEAKFK